MARPKTEVNPMDLVVVACNLKRLWQKTESAVKRFHVAASRLTPLAMKRKAKFEAALKAIPSPVRETHKDLLGIS